MAWLKRVNQGQLHPDLVKVIELTDKKLEYNGIPFKWYSGLRTFAQQDELYAQGRTKGKQGAIVTKARGGQSMHNYGCAIDGAPFNLLTHDPHDLWWPEPVNTGGEVWYELEKYLMEAAREITDDGSLEYEWGGRWKFRDVPHVQVRTTLRELQAGLYPYCSDVDWLVKAHTTFLYDTPWMKKRIQYLLNSLEFNVGVVDGLHGSRTLAALEAYCVYKGMTYCSEEYDKEVLENLVRDAALVL